MMSFVFIIMKRKLCLSETVLSLLDTTMHRYRGINNLLLLFLYLLT